MNRLLAIGFVVTACVVATACGGSTTPATDPGTDPGPTLDEGPADDGWLAPDESEVPEVTRDIDRETASDEGTVEDVPELPPPPDADTEVPPGDEGDADADADACEGPACVPCVDDGLICTAEAHDPVTGECHSTLLPDFCLVGGECYFTLQPSPVNQCAFCVPASATDGFTPSAGLPCDDLDLCTSGDTCDAVGACRAGPATDCNDDNKCTIDRCEPALGCVYTNFQSTCDDHDACTYLDKCVGRQCVGTSINCNDNNDCTTDSCQPAFGCLRIANSDACSDGNACTESDTCTDKACVGTPVDCDDHNPCTLDTCAEGEGGGCLNQVRMDLDCTDSDACTTNDHCTRPDPLGPPVCVGYDRTCNDSNGCTLDSCDPAIGCVYTPYLPEVNPCAASGDPCTVERQCRDGSCQGVPNTCDDGNDCTIDSCDTNLGCLHVTTSGVCDDGNACTTGETCSTGTCKPPVGPLGVTDCNDRNECTTDDCLPVTGCLHSPVTGTCLDSDPCSTTGLGTCVDGACRSQVKDCNDFDSCTLDSCDALGNCIHAPNTGGACDDGNACMVGETCNASGECGGSVVRDCNDHSVCTIDNCRPDQGCVYTPTPGNCDDNSKCTINDQCSAGLCVGQAVLCEDSNLCTDNLCDAAIGCYYAPIERTCDDQNICTLDDQCVAGTCAGLSKFEDPSVKAGKLSLGLTGNPGQGVDVDGLETTCAPKGNCVKGIDNAFAVLSWLFNPEVIKANASGDLALLIEAEGPPTVGGPFDLNLFWGQRIAPSSCDPTTAGCRYGVSDGELQPVCEPVHVFDNAIVDGTRLTAGGKDYTLPMSLVFGSRRIPLTLQWAKIVATVSLADGSIVSGAGAIGGIVPLQEVLDGVSAIPAASFPPPYTRDIVLQYLNLYLKPDFDLDGDGTKESVSMGWPVTLVTAHISGPL